MHQYATCLFNFNLKTGFCDLTPTVNIKACKIKKY